MNMDDVDKKFSELEKTMKNIVMESEKELIKENNIFCNKIFLNLVQLEGLNPVFKKNYKLGESVLLLLSLQKCRQIIKEQEKHGNEQLNKKLILSELKSYLGSFVMIENNTINEIIERVWSTWQNL